MNTVILPMQGLNLWLQVKCRLQAHRLMDSQTPRFMAETLEINNCKRWWYSLLDNSWMCCVTKVLELRIPASLARDLNNSCTCRSVLASLQEVVCARESSLQERSTLHAKSLSEYICGFHPQSPAHSPREAEPSLGNWVTKVKLLWE